MGKFDVTVMCTLMLGTGCAVSSVPEGDEAALDESSERAQASTPDQAGDLGRRLVKRRYTIEELPTDVPSGRSEASSLICGRDAVVGSASVDSADELRAIVFERGVVTQLGTLGGPTSTGRAGNASGAIVGGASTGSSVHAFLYRGGVMKDLGTLGGAFSEAFAINNRGQIVGQSTLVTGGDVPSHAVLWDGCSTIDLGTLGGAESFARDINNRGVIVGTSASADDPFHAHAVVWRHRVIEELDDGLASNSQAIAINDAGTIVGFVDYESELGSHAVMWRHGTMLDLGNLGGSSFALGVNDRGEVVGASWDESGTRPHAFLYSHGEMLDLERHVHAPGWVLFSAIDICNDGRIVGNGTLDGNTRGFVLTPRH